MFMTIENDAEQRRKIKEYWDDRLKHDWEAVQEESRLRLVNPPPDPWFIRLLDWVGRKMDGVN